MEYKAQLTSHEVMHAFIVSVSKSWVCDGRYETAQKPEKCKPRHQGSLQSSWMSKLFSSTCINWHNNGRNEKQYIGTRVRSWRLWSSKHHCTTVVRSWWSAFVQCILPAVLLWSHHLPCSVQLTVKSNKPPQQGWDPDWTIKVPRSTFITSGLALRSIWKSLYFKRLHLWCSFCVVLLLHWEAKHLFSCSTFKSHSV